MTNDVSERKPIVSPNEKSEMAILFQHSDKIDKQIQDAEKDHENVLAAIIDQPSLDIQALDSSEIEANDKNEIQIHEIKIFNRGGENDI